jgi:hypothetical protein
MSFVCLAVTMVLFISLFLYFRQKILALEEKISLLSEVTTTMAGITTCQRVPPPLTKHEFDMAEPDECYDSENESDAESYSSSESSVSGNDYRMSPVMTFVKVDSDIKNVIVMDESTPKLDMLVETIMNDMNEKENEPEPDSFTPVELTMIDLNVTELSPVEKVELNDLVVDSDLPKRIVSTDDVKTLTLDSPYDAMTLKELKEKVAELNGPKLKTKKELIEYLKNKM